MDPVTALKELQARKEDLLQESEINRQVIWLEVEQVRCRVVFWKGKWGRARGAWKWVAPIAGFVFARKFNKTAGAFTAVSGLIPTLRKLWEAWKGRE